MFSRSNYFSKTRFLLHISYTLETYYKSSVTRFLIACKVSQEYLDVFISYSPFCSWNLVFHGLLRRIFYYNFRINEVTGFIVSGVFFHLSINIAAILLVDWLNITEDIEFSKLCLILMHNTLF